jgi:hypothetical protein
LHLLQIRFGLLGNGTSGSFKSAPRDIDSSNSPSFSGIGSASGGTAPGSVVMALKCDATANMAIAVNAMVCIFPQMVNCRNIFKML